MERETARAEGTQQRGEPGNSIEFPSADEILLETDIEKLRGWLIDCGKLTVSQRFCTDTIQVRLIDVEGPEGDNDNENSPDEDNLKGGDGTVGKEQEEGDGPPMKKQKALPKLLRLRIFWQQLERNRVRPSREKQRDKSNKRGLLFVKRVVSECELAKRRCKPVKSAG
uniref:Uncharacterized protein n=1 Tax=Chromera velia CCMP2878 TaxID=1169474 RepID=A0A0G4GF89_9ALVE|eukprot:Cvel_21630.t1-p1 / transcript=Cvel_21630.t1 / gene=Cvel_21630 / organism=Chromera_velia_CCMP2878 / gene_product=hypothetical protein / transcript_product=hypothetical protein / location=Cvel_scaffold2045:6488-7701(-) / protein_length=167 / sequence_SO=supercontig / SO=protein_coding / is_pseudo=false